MKKLLALAAMALVLTGLLSCREHLNEAQKKALYDKTAAGLVFVEGGSFMMGDGGMNEPVVSIMNKRLI